MFKLIIAFSMFSSLLANAGQQHELEHWYHGQYKLVTKSAIAEALEMTEVLIKDIPFDDKLPMIITLFPGQNFSEVNAPVYWDSAKEKFTFKLDTITWCEDYDCVGLSAIEGELIGHDTSNPTVILKASFYKDDGDESGPREWTETLVFGEHNNDGSYSF